MKPKGDEQQRPQGHSSSSSEETESCRRLVRSLYRGDWANLVFDKRSRRFFVEEVAPEAGSSFGS